MAFNKSGKHTKKKKTLQFFLQQKYFVMKNSFEKLSLDLFFYLRDLIRNKHSSCDFISKSSILKSINRQTTTTKASSSGFPKRKLFSLKLFLYRLNLFSLSLVEKSI